MDFTRYVDQLAEQAAAMRAAAIAAGPSAPAPTCPEWTVDKLVRHQARVHNWAATCLLADPAGQSPARQRPPEPWDELLSWWDKEFSTLLDRLTSRGADAPAWVFASYITPTAAFWARRQAHETAIHRLDAEHAAAGSASPDAVPTLVYDPDFAADGIDEVLHVGITRRLSHEPATVTGTVLLHAADAGRAWLVHVKPGQPPEIGPAEEPALDTDASVVGTADAVYRALWGRPSHAVRGGDLTLITALKSP